MIDLNTTKTRRHAASDEWLAPLERHWPLEERLACLTHLIATLTANPPPSDERAGRSVSASAVGDECARRVQLGIWPTFHPDARPPRKAPLDAKTLVIFARGHATEAEMGEQLNAAGYRISLHPAGQNRDHPVQNAQHGFFTAGGQIKGFADGIFIRDHDGDDDRRLWEHKTIQDKGWRKAHRHGVAHAYPQYAAQAQMLMAYMGAVDVMFTLLNADTGELYAEALPFDAHAAQKVSDRAVWILQATRAGDLLPKLGTDGQTFPCAWCRFKGECWPGE